MNRIDNKIQSFCGVQNIANKTTNAIDVPKSLKFFNYLGENSGELLNNLVTAVGTAGVAPIFIVNNPLSKENKDSRKYAAWRQPLSAIITVSILNKITGAFNKGMTKIACEGRIPRMDMSINPDYALYKKQIETEFANEKALFRNDKSLSRFKEKEAFPKFNEFKELRMKEIQTETFNKIFNKALMNNEYNSRSLDTIKLNELINANDIKKEKNIVLQDIFEALKLDKEQAKAYIKKIDTDSSVIINEKNEILKKNNIKLIDFENELNKKLSEIGINEKNYSKNKNIHKNIEQKLDIIIEDKISKKMSQELENATKMYFRDEILKKKKIDPKKFSLLSIDKQKSILKEVNKISKEKYKEQFRKIKIERWFRSQAERSANVFKNLKTVYGIFIGIGATLITCPILNWVYPRFMNEFLPHLANAKAKKPASPIKEDEKAKEVSK